MSDEGNLRLEACTRLMVPPKGVPIDFHRLLVQPPANDKSLVPIADWETFDGLLLGLFIGDGDMRSVLGSAVMVGPGVAISAYHVIEEQESQLIRGEIDVIAFGIAHHGIQLWRVVHVTRVDNTDLVILGLTCASWIDPNTVFNMSSITTRLPRRGERVFIAGVRPRDTEIRLGPEETFHIDLSVFVCTGQITEIYIEKRDTALLPFPVLEVKSAALGAMSGGPVFDQYGMLVGVLTSSFTTEENDGPAYVSLIYPALPKPFIGGWPESYGVVGKSLLEMHAAGNCYIDEPRAFEVDEVSEPGKSHCAYRAWNDHPFDPPPAFAEAEVQADISTQFVRLHVESVTLHSPERPALLVRPVVSPFGRPEASEYGRPAVIDEALFLQHLDELRAAIDQMRIARGSQTNI